MLKQLLTSPASVRSIVLGFGLVVFASIACGEPGRKTSPEGSRLEAQTVWPDKQFTVDAAGNISPQQDYLHSGQKAVWTFATASPANALVRQTWISPNYVAAPYDPTYVNELMTPLPKGMSGIFVISENQGGFIEQTTPCVEPSRSSGYPHRRRHTLVSLHDRSRPDCAELPEDDGLHLGKPCHHRRVHSPQVERPADGSDDLQRTTILLLSEVDKAVANGKVYSIGIKSGAEHDATPTWLFDPAPAGAGLTPVILDWNEDSTSCNTTPHALWRPDR